MTANTFQRDERATSRDRAVANQNTSHAIALSAVPSIQKKGMEDEELQLKSAAQLATLEEDELQMKSAGPLKSHAAGEVSQRKDNAAPETNHTGMPDHLKSGIENLSGFSMDDVKVHYNSGKPGQLNALAYAQGTDIHISPGQERHLPHEAWHVVQQKQGRVKPTMQMKGGVNVNDDKGLENESDVMGGKAIATVSNEQNLPAQRKNQGNNNLNPATKQFRYSLGIIDKEPIQRVMSVADFQEATPGGTFSPRTQGGVQQIDVALGTYIGGRTAATALNLIGVLTPYIAGNHSATRKAVATNLRTRVQQERNLLVAMGDANAFLVDGLIDQVGVAAYNDLHTLAVAVPAAKAATIPNIIAEVGVPNISDLDLLGLIAIMGTANMNLMADMITNSGGVAQLANLRAIVNRHIGQGHLAFDIAREAAGNAADFQRFRDDVFACTSTGAPVMPANVTVARNTYNTAKNTHFDATDNGVIAVILPDVTTMQVAATLMEAAAIAMGGAPAPLMANVALSMADINIHMAGLGNGLPLGFTFQDVRNNINILNGLLNGVRGWANGQAPSLHRATILAQLPNFTAARGNFNGVAFPVVARARDVNQIDYPHFFQRHTRTHFDFTDIKPQNTMWPIAWDPNPNGNVSASLIFGLAALAGANNWFQSSVPQNGVATGLAPTMRMVAYNMPDGTLRLGMVFPEANAGAGVFDYTGDQMRAILKVI